MCIFRWNFCAIPIPLQCSWRDTPGWYLLQFMQFKQNMKPITGHKVQSSTVTELKFWYHVWFSIRNSYIKLCVLFQFWMVGMLRLAPQLYSYYILSAHGVWGAFPQYSRLGGLDPPGLPCSYSPECLLNSVVCITPPTSKTLHACAVWVHGECRVLPALHITLCSAQHACHVQCPSFVFLMSQKV